jgi:hypothetical protein
MKRSILFGVASGLFISIVSLILFFGEIENENVVTMLQFIPITVTILVIFFSVKLARDHSPDTFDFRTGLKAGIVTALTAALLHSTVTFFLWQNEDPKRLSDEAHKALNEEIVKIPVPKDSTSRMQYYEKAIHKGDSSLAAMDYFNARVHYCTALAADSTETHAREKLDFMVSMAISDYLNKGTQIQRLIQTIIFQILIGAAIAALSFYILRRGGMMGNN